MADRIDLLLVSMKETQQLIRVILDRQDETDAKLDALAMDVHYIKGEIVALRNDVEVLKSDVEVLTSDVAILKADVEVLKSDVAVLKTDVAVLKTDVAVLKTDVAVLKTDVSSLKTGQQRQDKILELLSIRSVEQESKLRQLIDIEVQ